MNKIIVLAFISLQAICQTKTDFSIYKSVSNFPYDSINYLQSLYERVDSLNNAKEFDSAYFLKKRCESIIGILYKPGRVYSFKLVNSKSVFHFNTELEEIQIFRSICFKIIRQDDIHYREDPFEKTSVQVLNKIDSLETYDEFVIKIKMIPSKYKWVDTKRKYKCTADLSGDYCKILSVTPIVK